MIANMATAAGYGIKFPSFEYHVNTD